MLYTVLVGFCPAFPWIYGARYIMGVSLMRVADLGLFGVAFTPLLS